MIRKWMLCYWINYVVIILNAILFLSTFISISYLNITPSVISFVICMVPMVFSLVSWSAIRKLDANHVYLDSLFMKKSAASLFTIIVILAWSWWGGGLAVLVGSIVASWAGLFIFWLVGKKDFSCLFPEQKNNVVVPRTRGHEMITSFEINPTTGLPMMGAVDSKGNAYGAPAHEPKIYSDSSSSSRPDNIYDYFSSGNDHYRN
ncbi:hypothetical protein [Pantoea sp. BAV 3049]|uniref:hypothetical protein n=1 Tax=Pantoea sp. BAV 3049 TaxID=2654188 RepID=UPI00131C66C9|nr:hypothetical protein [Pantoea sp. BAV 3049]